jgi:hypothetical protein
VYGGKFWTPGSTKLRNPLQPFMVSTDKQFGASLLEQSVVDNLKIEQELTLQITSV